MGGHVDAEGEINGAALEDIYTYLFVQTALTLRVTFPVELEAPQAQRRHRLGFLPVGFSCEVLVFLR